MSKAIIDCVKKYFKECPHLDDLAKINVDYLNMDAKDYEYWSLEPLEVPVILKKNVIGTKTTRQSQFILATRAFINPLVDTQNIQNLHLFENIAEWIHENNKNKIFPILNDDETVISLKVTTGGYLYGTNQENTIARYQMQCRMIYEKKEGNKRWN